MDSKELPYVMIEIGNNKVNTGVSVEDLTTPSKRYDCYQQIIGSLHNFIIKDSTSNKE